MMRNHVRGRRRHESKNHGFESLESRQLLTASFAASESYAISDHLTTLAVGDFNNDGWADIATDGFESVEILLNNQDGTFTPQSTGAGFGEDFGQTNLPLGNNTNATAIDVADLTGNGNLDLIVAVETEGSTDTYGLMVFLGNGNGTFQTASSYTTTATSALTPVTGDFNGDGKPDIAVMESDGLNILMNAGDGTFGSPVVYASYPAGTSNDQSEQLAVGDFDADGKPDLAVSMQSNDNDPIMAIYHNQGNGTFAAPVAVAGLPEGNAITAQEFAGTGITKPADLNGDGLTDVVETGVGKLGVALNQGNGVFATTVSYPVSAYSLQPIVADFTGDGSPDIAEVTKPSSSSSAVLSVLANNGTGTFGTPTNYGLPSGVKMPVAMAVADFDHDGKPDVVVLDNDGSSNGGFLSTIGILLSGTPSPKLAAIPTQQATIGRVVNLTAVGTDAGTNKTLTYAASAGTIDPNTGAFSYTVPSVAPGTLIPVTITVTDNSSPPLSATETFSIQVLDVAPVVIPDNSTLVSPLGAPYANITVQAGQLMSVPCYFVDPDPQTWTGNVQFYDDSPDAALTFNADKTFTVTHTFASAGTYSAIIAVYDSSGGLGLASLIITVTGSSSGGSGSGGSGSGGSGSGGSGSGGSGSGGSGSGGSGGSGSGGSGTVTPLVTVSSIAENVAKRVISGFAVQFNGPVSGAGNAGNYHLALVTTKRVKKHTVTVTKYIPVKSVSYNASDDVADVVPSGKMAPGKINQLTITASGITDNLGRPLDGNHDGVAGGDLVASVGKSVVTILSKKSGKKGRGL